MKFAFSTLGCPDWNFNEIITTAKDLNFDGIEIRGIEKEVFVPFAKPFRPNYIKKTIEKLKNTKVQISQLATGVCIGDSSHIESAYGEAMVYIDLAEKLSVKYIRIMITNKPFPEPAEFESAIYAMQRICDYAKTKGVTVLIETNGILANSDKMKIFIEEVNRENSGVLWDIHHPYRFFKETAEYTYNNIHKYVKYVHIKDSVIEDDEVKYKITGEGDVPVMQVLEILNKNNFEGFVTLEWVKRWKPNLLEPGIVFSHFADLINKLNK